MLLGNLLLFYSLFLHASAAPQPEPEPEPGVNIVNSVGIDINVNEESISNDVTCGIKGPSRTRIINGDPVLSAHTYSWQVGLSLRDHPAYKVACGGSIITNKHILTAAHCFPHGRWWKYFIGMDSNMQAGSIIMHEGEPYVHPDYNYITYDYDIAIIELSEPIDLEKNGIRPICIPKNDDNDYSGSNAIVSGWGSTIGYNFSPPPYPTSPNILQEAQVPVLSNTICQSHVNNLTGRMLCAGDMIGFESGGKDSCQGDSGGPLSVEVDGQYQQIGIVSFGYGCASRGHPGVYTRVTKFIGWINGII